jgi:beta-glucanase (GH16 family)
MLKKITLKTFAIILMSLNIGRSQTPVDLGFATLVWEDDFDFHDPTKWIIINDCDHNGDQQVYRNSNVSFAGGSMKINLRNEQVNYPSTNINIPNYSWACGGINDTSYNYTSGWVESTNIRSFHYGYIEAKIKFENEPFSSCGFWCWRNDGQQNYNNEAEIDIFELANDNLTNYQTSKFSTNIHSNLSQQYPNYPEINYYYEVSPTGFDFTEWHTYGIEKSPDRLIWYLDGEIIRILYNHHMIDPQRIIFNQMIVNLQSLPSTINSTMEISSFKCYDVNYACQGDGVICGSLFPNNVVFSNLSVGNNNCSNSINLGSTVVLKAQNSITLNNNFDCPLGGQLILQTGGCH